MFPDQSKKIIYVLPCLLGYYYNEWVDEQVLAYLSIFSTNQKPFIVFNFSQFIADIVHKQFIKLPSEGIFNYASIISHVLIYYQVDKFSCSLQKLYEEGNPQFVIL